MPVTLWAVFTRDEARRIAANIAKMPDLQGSGRPCKSSLDLDCYGAGPPYTLMGNPNLAYAVKFVPCHLLPRGIAMLYESGRGQRPPHFNRLREKDRSSLHVTC